MSRIQDQFIDDDEEETCPLCVEELDLTDKGFRPCPCGYQICQFCYHNVKTNMNGLCPACRRPYNDNDIEWKVVTPEETAAHKARQAQKQKKTQAALQKEKQKAEAENLSRKHLAGMRVVQKNLVYVTGLSPTSQEDQLLATLRGDQYFGQYGKIIKIVVSKARDPSHPNSVGVYVTYERKEDAANCIAAVDGTKNQDRTLRAQFGTTKYCSAYLRGETCSNRNCMFLHEPGEANESYSRADLSSLNAGGSQHGGGRPPPPQSQQPVSAAPPIVRQGSADQSSADSPGRPALPSSASWAAKAPPRTESRAASHMVESPKPVAAAPAPAQPEESPRSEAISPLPPAGPVAQESAPGPEGVQIRKSQISPLLQLVKGFKVEDFRLVCSLTAGLPSSDAEWIRNYPPLFDHNGGARRRIRKHREEEQRRMEQEAQGFQQPPAMEAEDNPEMSGSLQLGGEPEERQNVNQTQGAIQPPNPEGGLEQRFQFSGGLSSPGISDRGLTPHQHQQMLLQTLKPNAQGPYQQPTGFPSSFQHQPQQQNNQPLGHQRNVSRYSFANDSSSASAAVKPVANPKLMNQQSSMMPPSGANQFGAQHQQSHNQFYTSNVQGPPPGLKTTGTPPVSGNLTFGQGHGFATGGVQQYGAATTRNQQDHLYRELLRGREAAAGGIDAKHDTEFPPLGPSRQHSITSRVSLDESRRSTPPIPPGLAGQIANESRRSTPVVPPGLSKPTALPDLDGSSRPTSRPSSRASLRRSASQILPVVPLRPGTPSRPTPSRRQTKEEDEITVPEETPTKPSRNASHLKHDISAQGGDHSASALQAPHTGGRIKADAVDAIAIERTDVKEQQIATEPTAESLTHDVIADQKPILKQSDANLHAEGKAPETPRKPDLSTLDIPKRKHPGKLDITAAVAEQNEQPAITSPPPLLENVTSGKASRPSSQTQSTKLSESPPVSSPAVKAAPRTLRVVQTPKAETTPPREFPLPSVATHKLPSRQPSVASVNPPGTPSSELVSMSDNVSFTSTSASRANSPPPAASKVGTAPVRTKTKSQVKKERQERAKAIEEEKAKTDETTKTVEEEPAQEAIISRKKKTKKEKEPKQQRPMPTGPAVPVPDADIMSAASRPASPRKPSAATVSTEALTSTPKDVKSSTTTRSMPAPSPPTQAPNEPSPPPTPTLTPAQLFADIKAAAPELQRSVESLFRVSNSHHFKTPPNTSHKDLLAGWKSDFNIKLTKEEISDLLNGKIPAVHRGGEHGHAFDRHVVSPSGAHLRALTKELETRFLELEKALREVPEGLRFRPSKPQNDLKLPAFDLQKLKRDIENSGVRGVSVMEQMVQDGSTMKKGAFLVDEASKYINEFVMPPVTPPPSASNRNVAAQTAQNSSVHQASSAVESSPGVPPLDIAERQLNDAKRVADEKEIALRKAMKKNKKLLGLA